MHVYTFENNVSLSSLCLGQFTYLATMRACMFETKPHRARKLLSLPGNHEGVHVWDRATRCKDTVILTWLPSGRACLRRSLQGQYIVFLPGNHQGVHIWDGATRGQDTVALSARPADDLAHFLRRKKEILCIIISHHVYETYSVSTAAYRACEVFIFEPWSREKSDGRVRRGEENMT